MHMNWNDEPVEPAQAQPQPGAPPAGGSGSIRRGFVTAALAGLLLVGGVAAAVSAASPDPSASSAPTATSDPSGGTGGNGGTAPSTRPKGDCPDRGSGDGGTDSSPDSSPDASPDSGTSSSDA